jgi:hypothetical protein
LIACNSDYDVFIRAFYVQGQTFRLKSWVIAESIRFVIDELRVSVVSKYFLLYLSYSNLVSHRISYLPETKV